MGGARCVSVLIQLAATVLRENGLPLTCIYMNRGPGGLAGDSLAYPDETNGVYEACIP